ncbi:hypothetical protein [Paenibacillus sp. KS-LC4]|uniref:DUF6060 domain-containing protein n=1 Tax=Paenibacillus sp. KS-LC4 TaxID=2979727 RepID=UPI0030CFB53A
MTKLFHSFSLLILVSLFVLSINAYANANEQKIIPQAEQTYYDVETGETITNIYAITEDGYKEISFETFKQIREEGKLNSNELETQRVANESPLLKDKTLKEPYISTFALISNYVQTSYSDNWYNETNKVTNNFSCPANGAGCSVMANYSLTKTEQFTAGMDSTYKSIIKGAVSFSWISSASVSSSYRLDLKPGQTGYINFMPAYRYTSGKLTVYSSIPWSTEKIYEGPAFGASPRKLSTGELEGIVWGVVS